MKPIAIASLVTLLVLSSGAALAQKQPATALMGIDLAGNTPGGQDGPAGVPDTILTVDISGVECWDSLDDPDNTVLTECLGPDAAMTGIGWNVTLTTNGASWLSECVTYFDAADLDGSGLFLTVGVGNSMPGTMTFDSGGILDLTDNGIPNIEMQADGLLYIQFFESFDDVPDSVDGFYEDGSFYDIAVAGYDVVFCGGPGFPEIPTLDAVGLAGLALLLCACGAYVSRRRLRPPGPSS
jgi:hypothetical protein